ncbi:hypothetical protein [Streptomyces asoensis]|uniref:Uncharacterized protein n=1 Tax=Streptomyces asoensis TaxID=249586 RepID=A0ABQ3S522_9ACTN|nr:hypothetical protein [Streptomyces asoensis]GGQ65439.1 hypothetical protein GCM10010496_31010 [Streptomyces asoensis]GHI63218.1 hypothetical protein Saso_48680 [Streptomyces asoensis]
MSSEHSTLRVRVTARDADTLRTLLRETRPDVGGRVRRDEDGRFGVDAFVSAEQAEALDREGVTVTVHEDATAGGRARQAEVARGDRFAPEDAVPHGLARKVPEA